MYLQLNLYFGTVNLFKNRLFSNSLILCFPCYPAPTPPNLLCQIMVLEVPDNNEE